MRRYHLQTIMSRIHWPFLGVLNNIDCILTAEFKRSGLIKTDRQQAIIPNNNNRQVIQQRNVDFDGKTTDVFK